MCCPKDAGGCRAAAAWLAMTALIKLLSTGMPPEGFVYPEFPTRLCLSGTAGMLMEWLTGAVEVD